MLSRLSIHQKKSEISSNADPHVHHHNQQNQKQNNQQNLNRVKRTLKLSELDPSSFLKPTERNYLTNADNRLNINPNYNSSSCVGQLKSKLILREEQKKQMLPKKQKKISFTQQYYELYGKQIIAEHELRPIYRPDFLKNHQIDSVLRARMLDWMIEVTKSYKFINKSYFASVDLMDRYFLQAKQSIPVSQLHILGVISMYIASKMQQIYPLKIRTIYEKIVHKKITRDALIQMQQKMFQTLKYKVNSWTFFDLALLKIANQIGNEDLDLRNKVEEVISFVSKCILYDYDLYIRYDMETFARVLIKIAGKISHINFVFEPHSASCYEDIVKSYKKLKLNFKGSNNIFKFSDQKIVSLVDQHFLEELKTQKSLK